MLKGCLEFTRDRETDRELRNTYSEYNIILHFTFNKSSNMVYIYIANVYPNFTKGNF